MGKTGIHVAMRRFLVTIVAVENSVIYILCVCACARACVFLCARARLCVCVTHALVYIVICGLSGSTIFFSHYLINGTIFGTENLLNRKYMFEITQCMKQNLLR
jgi:hypothetical protein